ncbi:LysM peptidoglycan-binding domain-containing protein [Xylanimonas allomyrinae]|uniref:LysM peptidoglycan-binding domain-containing protein n=1 Tax=Xylanimonas allomyrinae TaxID=2509459 RepID=A0A4P6EKP0_9MICO|nr:LysM peptidoglycan-binding domain-containing protein [Xylanimonas allomyrinae]QAY63202.1 LysM peptidoglycan-binding domain-containing protein [Xylanimonas allomyrinae]
MRPATARLHGVAGILAIVAFLVAVPALLTTARITPWDIDWAMVGQRLSLPDNGTLLVILIGLAAWAGWAYFALAILTELTARARGTRTPHLHGFALPQGVARRIIDVAALAFTALPTLAATAPPAHGEPITVVAPRDPTPTALTAGATSPPSTATATVTADAPATVEYTVRRGDSLWRIADQRLGDGHRWTEIHDLNRASLGDTPDLITPGTRLLLPAETTAPAPSGDYIVQPGDTLSQIAMNELGDPNAYPRIADASRDIVQPGGQHLTDPDHIEPGWTLDLTPDGPPPAPIASTTPAPTSPRETPAATPDPAPDSSPATPIPSPTTPAPSTAPGQAEAHPPAAAAATAPDPAADEAPRTRPTRTVAHLPGCSRACPAPRRCSAPGSS